MSTPESLGVKAERPAERALFHALFDDAAVFPPGLTPLPRAVSDHVARQSRSYADLVGPLLLPASAVQDFLALDDAVPQVGSKAGRQAADREAADREAGRAAGRAADREAGLAAAASVALPVVLVGRPGSDLTLVGEAFSRLAKRTPRTSSVATSAADASADATTTAAASYERASAAVKLVGVEIGWSAGWHGAKDWSAETRDISLSIEVPFSSALERTLSEIQEHADAPFPVQAKFRTGATPERPAPTSTELATFIRACVDHDLSFKLTGGLHHALSATTRGGEAQLGFLNVIAATRWALAHGAEVSEMEPLLSERDPLPILDIITRMSQADASVVRAFFTSYGCCGVLDPIGDLAALGLIKETTSQVSRVSQVTEATG